MFQYGRYLLLSGANGAAMNLQGLWADGKQSTWNGDYHLNINLQMMYWAADAVGLGAETMLPLVTFLRRLREQGEKTAMQLYGYPGWVAHGFTDGYMRAGIGGDIKWAYCITCGAWAALSLWDHVTFAPAASASYTKALEELLVSFQGIARFLARTWWMSRGTLNTGPTTSPENSFSLGKGVSSTRLTMSPALDLSVLRNVADATCLLQQVYLTLMIARSPTVPLPETSLPRCTSCLPKGCRGYRKRQVWFRSTPPHRTGE